MKCKSKNYKPSEFSKSNMRRDKRRKEARERQAERKTRSPEEQLQILNLRLGKNKGAEKERKRLKALINAKATKRKNNKRVSVDKNRPKG